MRKLLFPFFLAAGIHAQAQTPDTAPAPAWKKIYRETSAKVNDLVHTRLEVKFDYSKSWMYGNAWITLHPHFYPTDSLNLDAKGMTIEEISLVTATKRIPLKYIYDSLNLHIKLDKKYKAAEQYIIYVKYISKPNGFKDHNATSMAGSKGLYFINPSGEIKGKPTQIWTQGETEGNSYWVPTIDKPNQKTTDEISMTVEAKYLTLSNGLLVKQQKNADGTRTDTWKMDLPHAPYLLFMAVGDYALVKDRYKEKEVSYYVEKEYEPYARKIFGNTPEMIAFFSRITGVDYPWPKYAQISARDYIFGAMENTSATLHEESSQQDARQLADGNEWEDIIAHELFHQWFGDYVTTESWSNITLNESFADYSETLWNEYKYGRDEGQRVNNRDLRTYLGNPANATKSLVRFNYNNVFDAFDDVAYQKGGCVLNMLRNYVGDSAFFKSLKIYLTSFAFKPAEAHNLRLIFEEVTGKDLNWFWNQWYYGAGHPVLDINYNYNTAAGTATVFITQKQKGNPFILPFAIDVYQGNDKKRYQVWMKHAADSFTFHVNGVPDLINVDGDKMLLCEKTDHKTAANFIYQYNHGSSYADRREAMIFFTSHKEEPRALEFIQTALQDKNKYLREATVQHLDAIGDTLKQQLTPVLTALAKNDPYGYVRADALQYLGAAKNPAYKSLFAKATTDSSYNAAGKALEALAGIDSIAALTIAKSLMKEPAKGALQAAICNVLGKYGEEESFNYIYGQFIRGGLNTKFGFLTGFTDAVIRTTNTEAVKQQVDVLVNYRDDLPAFLRQFLDENINGSLTRIAAAKKKTGAPAIADYIQSKIPASDK